MNPEIVHYAMTALLLIIGYFCGYSVWSLTQGKRMSELKAELSEISGLFDEMRDSEVVDVPTLTLSMKGIGNGG